MNPSEAIGAALRERFGEEVPVPADLDGIERLARIAGRRVCRSYSDRPVEPDLLRLLCACALSSPSKSDLQQRDIVVVRDPDLRRRIADLLPHMPWVGTAPAFPMPTPEDKVFNGLAAVSFTQNFEMLDLRDGTLGPTEWLRWVRLADRDGVDPMVELICIADCLPPAALKLIGGPAPVSSMTWQLNLLGAKPRTENGWWLLRASSDHAKDGSSSQTMAIWNSHGTPIAEQMQSVAIFA